MSFSTDNVAVFLAVLDQGSFSAAARTLGRVPSAVSMTIAGLEAELDLPLFDRSGREPKPTAAARSLEPQARLLAAQLKALQVHALELTQGLEHRLTLAIAPELLSSPWSAALATLAQALSRSTDPWRASGPGTPRACCSRARCSSREDARARWLLPWRARSCLDSSRAAVRAASQPSAFRVSA